MISHFTHSIVGMSRSVSNSHSIPELRESRWCSWLGDGAQGLDPVTTWQSGGPTHHCLILHWGVPKGSTSEFEHM